MRVLQHAIPKRIRDGILLNAATKSPQTADFNPAYECSLRFSIEGGETAIPGPPVEAAPATHGKTPRQRRPFSVKVPVLSKQATRTYRTPKHDMFHLKQEILQLTEQRSV